MYQVNPQSLATIITEYRIMFRHHGNNNDKEKNPSISYKLSHQIKNEVTRRYQIPYTISIKVIFVLP